MKFVDISCFYNNTKDARSLLHAHAANLGYMDFLPEEWDTYLLKFLQKQGTFHQGRIQFNFFKGNASPLWIPFKANKFIAKLRPELVLFHGMIYPLQLLMLRRRIGKHARIIVQHHAELPASGIKGRLQRLAANCIDAYIFSAKELSDPWVKAGIIPASKVFEVMEGSTHLQRIDKEVARQHLQLPQNPILLWVGRLNANKDPLTILQGFEKFLQQGSNAKLYMVFQDNELLPLVQQTITDSALLRDAVVLIGKVDKEQMAYWYSAADVYVSGSRSEGSGYALIEAMSCGCIPVVTDIPAFRKITAGGSAGLLFNCGDAEALFQLLCRLERINKDQLVNDVLIQFEKELSFKAIARQLVEVFDSFRAVLH